MLQQSLNKWLELSFQQKCLFRAESHAVKDRLFNYKESQDNATNWSNIWQYKCHICIIYWKYNLQIYDSVFCFVCEREHMFDMLHVTEIMVFTCTAFISIFDACFLGGGREKESFNKLNIESYKAAVEKVAFCILIKDVNWI